MHIVVIPSWYKSDKNPYAGSFFEEQARALMSAGNKVRIFFPFFSPSSHLFRSKPDLDFNRDDKGLITRGIVMQSIIPRSKRLNNRFIQWQSDRWFQRYIEIDGKPDLIHAHSVWDGGLIGIYLSQKYDIPLVLTEHLTHFTGSLVGNNFKIDIARKICMQASRCIAVSEHFKNDLERELRLDNNVFQVVYNMVANGFYEKFVPRTWKPGEEFVFFTNSFLNERKNHILQFEALRILIGKNYPVKLIVGGSGEWDGILKQFITDKGLGNHVVFLGGLKREQVKQQIDSSHAFLLSSLFESFGVVLIESIASGRPVISTSCGGPLEIVNDLNGYLVSSFEAPAYAAAMEKMILNYNSFSPEKMREDCYSRFSETKISADLMKVYAEAIEEHVNSRNYVKAPGLRQQAASIGSWLFFLE